MTLKRKYDSQIQNKPENSKIATLAFIKAAFEESFDYHILLATLRRIRCAKVAQVQ
jgi:hypothetical protein